MMRDRRRDRRIDLKSSLMVKRIDDGNTGEVTIEIHDVSKTGIGFVCNEKLEMDAVYESHLTIWTKEVIHTLLKIVRIEEYDDAYLYGASFIGISEQDAFRIAVYDAVEQEKAKMQNQQQK